MSVSALDVSPPLTVPGLSVGELNAPLQPVLSVLRVRRRGDTVCEEKLAQSRPRPGGILDPGKHNYTSGQSPQVKGSDTKFPNNAWETVKMNPIA